MMRMRDSQGLSDTLCDICKSQMDAIDLHINGTWKLVPDEDSDTEDTDHSEEEENEEDWEYME